MAFLKYKTKLAIPIDIIISGPVLKPWYIILGIKAVYKVIDLFTPIGDTPFAKLCKIIDDAISKDDFKALFKATKDVCGYIDHNNHKELEHNKKAKEILYKGIEIIQNRFDKAKMIAYKAKNYENISNEDMEFMKNMLNDIR